MKTTKDKLNKKEVKEIFNSPSCKKWIENLEKALEEEYKLRICDYLLYHYHKENAKIPSRTITKKKGKK